MPFDPSTLVPDPAPSSSGFDPNTLVPDNVPSPTMTTIRDPQSGQPVTVPYAALHTGQGAPPPVVDPRGFVDRMSDEYNAAANSGFGGLIGKDLMYYTGYGRPAGMSDDQWDQALNQAQLARAQHFQQLDSQDPATGLGHIANVAGQIAGGVNPLYLFGGVAGSEMSPLTAAASRIGTVAAANAAGNALGQVIDIHSGLQNSFDPEAALATGAGAGLIHGALGEALPAAMPAIKKTVSDLLSDETSTGAPGSASRSVPTPSPAPVSNLSDSDKVGIDQMRRAGASTQDIINKYPQINEAPGAAQSLDWYVRHGPSGLNDYHGPLSFGGGIPKDATVHIESTPTDIGGASVHPVTIHDADGNVLAHGGVDAQTGMVAMSTPSGAPHPMSPADADIIRSKLPSSSNDNESVTGSIKITPADDTNGDLLKPTHTFTYTTADGTPINGSYRVSDNQIHSVDIGDQSSPVKVGAGEMLNAFKQISEAHPEVTGPDGTISGYRQTGANPGRVITMNADALRARTSPGSSDFQTTPTQPVNPLNTVTDKMAGNTNKNVLGLNPEANNILDNIASQVPENDVQGHSQTIEQARQMLSNSPDHNDFLYNTTHNEADLPAYQVATTALKGAKLVQIATATANGDTEGAAQLTSDLAKDYPRYQEIAGVPGRALNARGIKPTSDVFEAAGVSKDDLSKILAKIGGDPESVDQMINDASKSKNGSFLKQAYYASLLSNPDTHARYYTGMFANYVNDLASYGIGSALGQLRRFDGTDESRIYGREVAGRLYGSVMGIANAVQGLGSDLKKAGSNFQLSDLTPGNVAQSLINVPGVVLHGAEETMRNIAQTGDYYGMSIRHAIDTSQSIPSVLKNPTPEILQHSSDYGKVMSLNDKPSPIAQAGLNALETLRDNASKEGATLIDKGVNGAAVTLVPFLRRGDAVTRAWIRNSLLGAVPGMDRYNTAAMKSAIAGSSADMDKLAGRIALAGGLSATAALMAMDGHITGDGPDNYQLRQQMMAGGWRPNSYKDSQGNYHSFVGIEPFSNNLTTIANLVSRLQETGDHKSYMDGANTTLYTVAHTLEDNEWMAKLSPIISNWNAQEGEHSQRNYLTNLPSAFVPAGVNAYNQEHVDPIKRDTSSPDMTTQTENEIKAKIPGLSQTLTPKLDVYGRPIPTNTAAFPVSKAETDPAVKEIDRLSDGKLLIGPAGKTYTDQDTGLKTTFTPDQQHQYQALSGQYIREDLSQTMRGKDYQNISDDDKRDTIKTIVRDQRANARDDVLNPVQPFDPSKLVPDKSRSKVRFDPSTLIPDKVG